jgi:hypothetical protein
MRSGTAETFKADFQTPPNVAKYMASLLPAHVKKVLEPTPGIGNITKALRVKGYKVTAPKDFFLLNRRKRFDAIVMNPPFSTKFTLLDNAPDEVVASGMRMGYWFLTECMKRSDIVIALMPWFTISDSDVRLRMLYRYGLKALIALPRKTFQFARIQTVIIVLQKGYKGTTEFKVFDCLHDDKLPLNLF